MPTVSQVLATKVGSTRPWSVVGSVSCSRQGKLAFVQYGRPSRNRWTLEFISLRRRDGLDAGGVLRHLLYASKS
eukprot:jgi/Botrbrau1/1204/Bobra.0163s0012.1